MKERRRRNNEAENSLIDVAQVSSSSDALRGNAFLMQKMEGSSQDNATEAKEVDGEKNFNPKDSKHKLDPMLARGILDTFNQIHQFCEALAELIENSSQSHHAKNYTHAVQFFRTISKGYGKANWLIENSQNAEKFAAAWKKGRNRRTFRQAIILFNSAATINPFYAMVDSVG